MLVFVKYLSWKTATHASSCDVCAASRCTGRAERCSSTQPPTLQYLDLVSGPLKEKNVGKLYSK